MVAKGTYERIEELLPKGKLKCLDLGCQTYRFEYSEYEVHRCDLVSRNLPNFKMQDLNALKWDYPENSFDVIRACDIIEHLENIWHFFRECSRILKSNGILVLSTPNPQSPASRKLFFQTGYFHWFSPSNIYEFQQRNHITPVFLWQLEWATERAGLKIEEIRFNDEDPNSLTYQEILIVKCRKK